jgi:serine/threonine protein kinase
MLRSNYAMRFANGYHALHGSHTVHDYFEVDGITYQALPLKVDDETEGRGGNSTVFTASEAESPGCYWAVKVSNVAENDRSKRGKQRRERFEREIAAMCLARERNKNESIVRIVGSGFVRSGDSDYRCIVMERASTTLRGFLELDPEIGLRERLHLCLTLAQSIMDLHDIGLYHRDIKPENILLIEDSWKLGDLGLVAERGRDCDGRYERIGSIGWLCPEAINKKYACTSLRGRSIVQVDEKSDAHQMGKLFWYVLQGDIPNGCLKSRDLHCASGDVYGNMLKPLLWYDRDTRLSMSDIIRAIKVLTLRGCRN